MKELKRLFSVWRCNLYPSFFFKY